MRGRKKLLLICLAGVAIVVAAAFYQSDIIGWWRGEAKYKGRYTNSWRAEMPWLISGRIGKSLCRGTSFA